MISRLKTGTKAATVAAFVLLSAFPAKAQGLPSPPEFGQWLGFGIACDLVGQNEATMRTHLGAVLRQVLNMPYRDSDLGVLLSSMDHAARIVRSAADERDAVCGRMKGDAEALAGIGRAVAATAAAGGQPPAAVAQAPQQAQPQQGQQGQRQQAGQPQRQQQAVQPPDPAPGKSDADLLAEGEKLRAEGRYAEAEPVMRRALQVLEQRHGADHPLTATAANNLAELERTQGKFDAADGHYKRAIAALEKALGPDDAALAAPLANYANLQRTRGRFTEADALLKRALAIREKTAGANSPELASILNSMAVLAVARDRYDEAEPLYRRTLSLLEAAYGDSHPNIAATLNNLANLYRLQGKLDEAEPLFERSVRIAEATRGPEHPETAAALANLAQLHLDRGRHGAAEATFKRSQAALEKALGPGHPDVAAALNNIAAAYRAAGRLPEAEQALQRSAQILERAAGPDHLDTATALANLASLDLAANRHKPAADRLGRVLQIRQQQLGADHPDVIGALFGLALAERAQNRGDQALAHSRAAVTALGQRGTRLRADKLRTAAAGTNEPGAQVVLLHLGLLAERQQSLGADAVARESFTAMQGVRGASTSGAVARMAARFAAGTDALAGVVRKRQDTVERWRTVDALLVRELSKPRDQRGDEQRLRSELTQLGGEIDALDRDIAQRFPEFAELSDPRPLELKAAQALLKPTEAMLVYTTGADASYLWVLRKDAASFVPLKIGLNEIIRRVTILRAAVDPAIVPDPGRPPPYPAAEAAALYREIMAPALPLLAGVEHVIVVPDGPLQSLPFTILVDDPAAQPIAWLGRKYAFSTLPAVSSLRALRRLARQSKATLAFVGFGDPVLAGHAGTQVVSRGNTVVRAAPATLFRQGAVADASMLRKLPSLPETADELRALAKVLQADERHIYLGANATERRVRQTKLTQFRIVAFATHGLMSGEFPGVAEPSLVLTPPARASEQDDGLLTASEIARLSLDADWTILSACNTAAADGSPGGEGLSGLAKAFFYAGSRALLVSHWQVETTAAPVLTTGAIGELIREPKIGRAEAMRRSIVKMMANKTYAHPMFWAPFVVVGEGGPG